MWEKLAIFGHLGTIPIDSHSKMVLFQMVIENYVFMCRARQELKGDNGPHKF